MSDESRSGDHGPSSRHMNGDDPPAPSPALAQHPDPAPSTAIRAAQARLLERLERWPDAEEPAGYEADEAGERYEIGEPFAVGGLGVIRRAYDHRLGREIAVKTLRRVDPEAARRFALEARITARLQHPAIVPLHDVGRFPGGEPYYCMKLVDGESLDRVIAAEPALAGRLRLLEHVLAAADAIAYAHQRGVLHRDIKPANILVGAHGETVVIDWGLAKDTTGALSGALASSDPALDAADVTGAGAIVGTLRYMPPEQARGEAVDARSDVFALGAVLFHVLAGRPPHARLDRAALLDRLLAGEVEDLRPLAAEAPRELVAIAQKAMSSRPADRYAGAAAFAEDLRRFLAGRLVDAHHYQPGELLRLWLRRHRVPVAAVGAALVALTAASIVYVQRVGAARERAEAAEIEALRRADAAVLAQAGGMLDEDPAEALRLLAGVDPSHPHDLRRTRRIAVAAVARGAPDLVLRGHSRPIESLAPLADGGLVSIDAGGAVWRWNLGTGRGEQVIDLQAPLGVVVAAAEAPVWAAVAGDHGVVVRGDEPPEPLDVAGLPLPRFDGFGSHRWELSRGGEVLAALGMNMNMVGFEPAAAYTWELTARPAKFSALPFAREYAAAMSPDGRTIALGGARRSSLLVRGDASSPLPELSAPEAFSPSGLYLVGSGAALSLQDGTTRPLAGRTLAFTRDDQALVRRRNANHPPWTDDPQLALIDLTTGKQRWEVDLYPSREETRAFARLDGGFVAADAGDRFAVRQHGRWTLWSMASGQILRVLEVGGDERGAFLADGRFVSTHNRDLWVWSAEPSPPAYKERWSTAAPDGSHGLLRRGHAQGWWQLARSRDEQATPLVCSLALLRPAGTERQLRARVDGRGRALLAGATRGACLFDADGRSRVIAADEVVSAVALAEVGETYALGLADGTVLASPGGDGPPARWRLDAPVESLWATYAGNDLIAATNSGDVFGLQLGDDEPTAIGRAQGLQGRAKPVAALDPRGDGAAIVLAGADTLVLYEDGAMARRSILLPTGPRLAYSPSGARLAISIAGRGVLVIAGADDPGQEFLLSEAIAEMAFLDEDELAIVGTLDSLLRLDVALGETVVLQRDYNVRSLRLGTLAPRRGGERLRVPAPGGDADAVPRDRHELSAWLAARAD